MTRILRLIAGYLVGGTLFLFLLPACFYGLSMFDYLFDYKMIVPNIVLRYILSGVLLTAGIFFVLWSNVFLLVIGKGGPAEGFGMAISPRTQKLVIKGPYRLCRHPMVFGALLTYLSVVLYLNSYMGLIMLVLLFSLGMLYLKYSEEKRLQKDFGEDYLEYRKKVPMIFPVRRKSRII